MIISWFFKIAKIFKFLFEIANLFISSLLIILLNVAFLSSIIYILDGVNNINFFSNFFLSVESKNTWSEYIFFSFALSCFSWSLLVTYASWNNEQ